MGGQGHVVFDRGIVGATNPLGVPVVGIRESHAPHRRSALDPTVGGPDLRPPIAAHARGEWLAGIRDLRALVAGDFSTIPEIAFRLVQERFTRGDLNVIGHLFDVLFSLRVDLPGKPRRRRVDSQRIGEVFATQVSQFGGSRHGPHCADGNRQQADEQADAEWTEIGLMHRYVLLAAI